jgi:hypothetical protein
VHFVRLHFNKCNNQWIAVRTFSEISSADAGFKVHIYVKCLEALQDLQSTNLHNFRLTAFKKNENIFPMRLTRRMWQKNTAGRKHRWQGGLAAAAQVPVC